MPDIQFLGRACIRVRGKEGIVVTDPFPKANGFDPGKPSAQIVTLSSNDRERLNSSVVKPVKDRVFVIDGPGEYEVGGIMINGVRTYRDDEKGAQQGYNTIYVLRLDDMTFCHLGELGHELTTRQLEEVGTVDVLFVPAQSQLTPAKLAEIIASIEPRAVIPLYETSEQLEKLAHELGLKEWEAQEKLSVSPTSLPAEGEEMRVMIMRPVTISA
ncbi:MAG: MBL fold metallo-hydrolase [Chloroflexota bacterium]|nr:MBL fold metallo-hydrolase [Chloroflexota bacterium]PLS82077.1 MAG: Zn-dependent hydrolase [Chloroflexota bacterium]